MKNEQEVGALEEGLKLHFLTLVDHNHGSPKCSFLLVNIPNYWFPSNVLINQMHYFVVHRFISTSFSASCDGYR